MSLSQLNAFYDLQVSPAYFDFLTFMEIAELHRMRYNLDKINFIFVPGPKQGFRNDQLRTPESNFLMMRNVLLPACHLLTSCNGVNWLPKRDMAHAFLMDGNPIYPRNYSVETPVAEYLEPSLIAAYLRGETPAMFNAPQEHHNQVHAFIKDIASNKKIITLTLRESDHDNAPNRQANISSWKHFFNEIDKRVYQPIIVRDTSKIFADKLFPDYPEAPLASNNVLFRTALYQNAYINMMYTNGPYACCRHTASPMLVFNIMDYSNSGVACLTPQFMKEVQGLNPGNQLPFSPKSLQYAWDEDGQNDNDDTENLIRKFNNMVEKIESGTDLKQPNGFSSIQHAASGIETTIRKHLFAKFQRSVSLEDLIVMRGVQAISQNMKFHLDFKELIFGNEGSLIPNGTYENIKILNERNNVGLILT